MKKSCKAYYGHYNHKQTRAMVNVVMESFDGHEACSTLLGPPDREKLGDNVSACLFVHVLSAAFNENHTLDKLYTEVSLAHGF